MTVTEIKAVTKQKYQVEIDGQFAFVLYKGELSRYGIEKDREISDEVYTELVEEVLTKRAKLRAMHLLQKIDEQEQSWRENYSRMAIQHRQSKLLFLM